MDMGCLFCEIISKNTMHILFSNSIRLEYALISHNKYILKTTLTHTQVLYSLMTIPDIQHMTVVKKQFVSNARKRQIHYRFLL